MKHQKDNTIKRLVLAKSSFYIEFVFYIRINFVLLCLLFWSLVKIDFDAAVRCGGRGECDQIYPFDEISKVFGNF